VVVVANLEKKLMSKLKTSPFNFQTFNIQLGGGSWNGGGAQANGNQRVDLRWGENYEPTLQQGIEKKHEFRRLIRKIHHQNGLQQSKKTLA
jgi:hypothetical protein